MKPMTTTVVTCRHIYSSIGALRVNVRLHFRVGRELVRVGSGMELGRVGGWPAFGGRRRLVHLQCTR